MILQNQYICDWILENQPYFISKINYLFEILNACTMLLLWYSSVTPYCISGVVYCKNI